MVFDVKNEIGKRTPARCEQALPRPDQIAKVERPISGEVFEFAL
jgi:hypothetical protein